MKTTNMIAATATAKQMMMRTVFPLHVDVTAVVVFVFGAVSSVIVTAKDR